MPSFYPEPKKLGAQLKYADSRGFQVALIAGSQELEAGTCQVKNLATKQSQEIAWRNEPQLLVDAIKNVLSQISGSTGD